MLLSSASCTPRKRKDLEPYPEPPSPDKPTNAKPPTTKPELVRSKSKPTSIKPNPVKSKKVLNSKSEKKPVTVKKEPGTKEQVRVGTRDRLFKQSIFLPCCKRLYKNLRNYHIWKSYTFIILIILCNISTLT